MKAFLTRFTYKTDEVIHLLAKAGIELEVYDKDEVCPRVLLLEKAAEVDALLSHTEDLIDQEVFTAGGERLKVVANMGIGFSNIDLDAATANGVVVTNTPVDEAFDATAEATVALLISVARRIPTLHHQRIVAGEELNPSFLSPTCIAIRNKTCGIVGLGRIGTRVGKMMHEGFKNRILYYDAFNNTEAESDFGAKRVELDELLKTCDFICVNIPLSDATKNLISADKVALIKSKAVFVNAARDGIVDEASLVERLNKGELHGAGLDVYTDKVNEIAYDNIALTAHLANFEDEAYTAMSMAVVNNAIEVLAGRSALTQVNR